MRKTLWFVGVFYNIPSFVGRLRADFHKLDWNEHVRFTVAGSWGLREDHTILIDRGGGRQGKVRMQPDEVI